MMIKKSRQAIHEGIEMVSVCNGPSTFLMRLIHELFTFKLFAKIQIALIDVSNNKQINKPMPCTKQLPITMNTEMIRHFHSLPIAIAVHLLSMRCCLISLQPSFVILNNNKVGYCYATIKRIPRFK